MKKTLLLLAIVTFISCNKSDLCYECRLIDEDTGVVVDTSEACAPKESVAQENASSLLDFSHPDVWKDSIITVECELIE